MAKWNDHNSVDQMLAARAFALQRATGGAPDRVMASARKIRQYSYGPQDVLLVRSFISKTPEAARAVLSEATGKYQGSGKYTSDIVAMHERFASGIDNLSRREADRAKYLGVSSNRPSIANTAAQSGVSLRGKEKGVARAMGNRILSWHGEGVIQFTPKELAAADNAAINKGTTEDLQQIREAFGIRRTGATAARKGLKEFASMSDKLGGYLALADVASRGGMKGFAAGTTLAMKAGFDIDALAHDEKFQKAVIRAFGKYTNLSDADLKQLPTKIGGAGRIMAAGAAYIAAGAAITKTGVDFVEAVSGANNLTDRMRKLKAVASMARADQGNYSAVDAKLATMRVKELEQQNSVSSWVPLFSSARAGRTAQRIGDLETRSNLFNSGFSGDAGNFRDEARRRLLGDKYGFFGGNMAEKFNNLRNTMGIPAAELEKEITAKSAEMVQTARDLRLKAYQQIELGNLKTGNEYLRQAKIEMGQPAAAWQNPAAIWTMMEAGRAAARGWALVNMARKPWRTGD